MMEVNRLRCDVLSDWTDDFSQCLYEWQGLEGGGLALLAAFVGAVFLRKQIGQAQQHREDDIARRHVASKLTMPLALSLISEVIEKISDEVATELETYTFSDHGRTIDAILSDGGLRKRFDQIYLSDSAIGAFENFVETLSNENDVKHVSELISQIQILISRFNGFEFDSAGAYLNLESMLIEVSIVKILSDSMFNYARNVDQSSFGIVGILQVEDSWQLVRRAAKGLIFSRKNPEHFYPAIDRQITGYIESRTLPWLEKFPL